MVFLKTFFEDVDFDKNQQTTQMQKFPGVKEIKDHALFINAKDNIKRESDSLISIAVLKGIEN